MKKLLIVAIIGILFSCSKTSNENANAPDSTMKEISGDAGPIDESALAVDRVVVADQVGLAAPSKPPSVGYYCAIEGTHFDLVKFYRNGRLIASDNIRNGDDLGSNKGDYKYIYGYDNRGYGVWTGYPPGDFITPDIQPSRNAQAIVAVRHGALRDLVSVYAYVGDSVYRSKEWGDYGPGEVSWGVQLRVDNAWFNGKAVAQITGYPFYRKEVGNPTLSSSHGRILFNLTSRTWEYEAKNGAGWSTEEKRRERPLDIEKK